MSWKFIVIVTSNICKRVVINVTADWPGCATDLVLEEDPDCSGRVVVSSQVEAGPPLVISAGRLTSQLYQLAHQTRLVLPNTHSQYDSPLFHQ